MAKTTKEVTVRCDARKVQVGSVFSRHSHGIVTKIQGQRFFLKNDIGIDWELAGDNILEGEFSFADQYEDESKESRTKVIEVLKENSHTACTVVFRKKADMKHMAKELAKGQGKLSDREWLKKVEELDAGELRTMEGYHTNSFDEHGRLRFNESGKGPRLIDPRTIESVIVARQKLVVK